MVGSCPNSGDPFCGNPNANFLGQNSGEQYAYLNFFDKTGFFDKVVLTQIGSGGFESDNDAVGFLDPIPLRRNDHLSPCGPDSSKLRLGLIDEYVLISPWY